MKPMAFLLPAFLIINLTGCAGIKYRDQPQSAKILDLENSKAKSRVLAKAEEWRNSGAVVEKGKSYSIRSKGRWTVGGACGWTGPDGIGVYNLLCPFLSNQIMKSWSHGMLIGRINENGAPFAIGNDLELTPQETGTLYYRINDAEGFCGDNDGYVDVEIALLDKDKYSDRPRQLPIPPISASTVKDLPKIAVWDLSPRNTPITYAQELTSILVSEITRIKKYEVYSQENVRTLAGWTEERMKLGCTSTQCLTALGQMDVGKLISGSVGKIGDTYSISLNLFDTQNAKAQNSVSELCTSENELIGMVKKAVRNLLGETP